MAFSLEALRQDVRRGIDRPGALRLILEARNRSQMTALQRLAAQHLDVPLTVEPLFPAAVEEDRRDEAFDLATFALLRIPGLSLANSSQNVFDLGYNLRDHLDLLSAEPDLPVLYQHPQPDVALSGGCEEPQHKKPLDRAWSLRQMDVEGAWTVAGDQGEGIRIGHIDTGYTQHIDLDAINLRPDLGYDFVDDKSDPQDPLNYSRPLSPGHGPATGSVIISLGGLSPEPAPGTEGGTTGPGKITGVAPRATLVPIRSILTVVRMFFFNGSVARGIHHATRSGCHVISMSLGGAPSRAVHAALRDAVQRHVVVVAAAGNCVRTVVFPARYRESISVAASNKDWRAWKGSSRGARVDITAPGEFVWHADRRQYNDPIDRVEAGQGTSYGTANVAGVAALWLRHLGLHDRNTLMRQPPVQEAFRVALRASATVPPGWDKANYGAGIVNARRVLGSQPGNTTAPTPLPFGQGYYGDVLRGFFRDLMPAAHPSLWPVLLRLSTGPDSSELDEFGHELAHYALSNQLSQRLALHQVRMLTPDFIGPRIRLSDRVRRWLFGRL